LRTETLCLSGFEDIITSRLGDFIARLLNYRKLQSYLANTAIQPQELVVKARDGYTYSRMGILL
jgi:hypothetical protein